MRLEIRRQDIPLSHGLRNHVARRVYFALGRFDGSLTNVTVRLADLNGPRGGVDKRCRITVSVRARERIVVEDADSDVYAAVDRAAERARRAVWRQLERRREGNVQVGDERVNAFDKV